MRSDPPVRQDGRCAVCHGPRPDFAKLRRSRAEAEADPFCASTCARRFHGQPDLDAQGRESLRKPRPSASSSGRGAIVHGTVAGYRICACESCKQAVAGAKLGRKTEGSSDEVV